MSRPNHCLYCLLRVDGDNFLHCKDCDKDVHITCLKRPGTPGDIVGDVFFEFRCSHCTDDGKEEFERIRLPWAMLVVMALHNLSVQSMGLSHQGYFHWRTHIACFIEKNWNHLIGANVKKKKKWIGTISGTLSHNTPVMFSSGFNVFNEAGWWKLTHNLNPKQYMDFYHAQRADKSKVEKVLVVDTQESEVSVEDEVDIMTAAKRFRSDYSVEPEVFSRSIPYMGRTPWKQRLKPAETTSTVEADLTEFLSSNMLSDDLAHLDLTNMAAIADDPECEALLPGSRTATISMSNDWPDHFLGLDIFNSASTPARSESVMSDEPPLFEPRIVQVTNFQAGDRDYEEDLVGGNEQHFSDVVVQGIKKEVFDEDEEDEDYDTKYPTTPSLFKAAPKRRLPWIDDGSSVDPSEFDEDRQIERMSNYEEADLMRKLRQVFRNCDAREEAQVPDWVRRFYRKLCVREIKRNLGKPVFDVDDFILGRNRSGTLQKSNDAQVLDRYHHLVCGSNRVKRDGVAISVQSRLAGVVEHELFESPHTGRVLHPFIYRDSEQMPQWIKLMCELQYMVNGKMPTRATIDYCYVRPHHIAAINGLLQKTFWPGIDMSECLSYPEFSIVALYKRLVIGCAFLVPDVGHNDAYVSFMAVRHGWQRSGIATFMLYHLTQTCMGKDITLHVSATNPAICLYQKFGFKMEEVILDFYDKYLPVDSPHSRHAFFLRMRR